MPADQAAQQRSRLGATFAHVEMRVGAVADEAVQQRDVGVRDVGVQVEGGDDRGVRSNDAPDQRQQRALGVVIRRSSGRRRAARR